MTEHPPIPPDLQDAILDWYAANGRDLAFRRTKDPYAILVLEAMAQQTQAARAADRWERFMARFPTVEVLAVASPADVLREWQGLGYDRRGLNLWRAAGVIVTEHGGKVPSDLAALEALPGVGPYTARAVAAIAFGAPVGAVDTNVRRVLSRIVVGATPVGEAASARAFQALADAAVPVGRSAAWTHALMDLGATVCRAASADCSTCPAAFWCAFATSGASVRRAPRTRTAERATPFASTNRWLRGRILDRLRAADASSWVTFTGPLGAHDADAVTRALAALATDGLIEHRDRSARLRVT